MPDVITITDVRFAPARRDLRSKGLLGWVCLTLDGRLQLDGLAVRQTSAGHTALSFPARSDGAGGQHAYVRPLTNELRDAIESQVIGELRRRGYVT